jgi:hypothetical protein
MKEISCFADLHSALDAYRRDNRWMFRGQACLDWQLAPKAGREPYRGKDDLELLEAWARRATEFTATLPSSVWERMALAQHHGLPTRLLDWSYNPLVAAFFACCEKPSADGVIFCLLTERVLVPPRDKPSSLTRVVKYRPAVVATRIGRQGGLFSAHPDPETDLEATIHPNDTLEKLIIKSACKRKLLLELSHYGVNRVTLMGDLDGLSSHMRWTLENRDLWGKKSVFESALLDDIH